MYLIIKLGKEVMENSLQNMTNDQTKTTEKITTTNNTSPKNEKETLETSNKKKAQSEKETKTKYLIKTILRLPSRKFSIPVLKRKNF